MKLPAFQFYPGDWRKDENLSRCSLAAKGALIEILCLAFQCEKKGVLMTGKKPWSMEDICMAIGGDFSVTKSAVEELLKKNVLKKDKKGCIFSARMVKDEQLRKVRSEGGKLGSVHGFKGKDFGKLGGRGVKKPPLIPPLIPPPSSSSSSSSSDIDIKKSKKENAVQFPLGFPVDKWQQWKLYRKSHFKKSYKTAMSEQTAINKALKDAEGDFAMISEMIDRSIAHGWQGLFQIEKKVIHLNEDDRRRRALL